MNLFICQCKDDDKEEKSAMDLLNIKNLENSLKIHEKKMKFSKLNFLEKSNDLDINDLENDLEIIDYPYNTEREKIVHNNFDHILKVKSNIIIKNKNNKLFNSQKENNMFETKDKSKKNSSSIISDSIIVDNIDYLNDEDSLKISNKENQNNIKPIQIKINFKKLVKKNLNIKNKININKYNNLLKSYDKPKKDTKNNIYKNESFKSGTTEISTIKKAKNNIRKNLSEKKDNSFRNKLNKKFLDKYNDYKEFKNDLNKTFEEFTKSNYSKEKMIKIYNDNNNIKIFNISPSKNIKIKQTKTKGNNIKNLSKNKRIVKRKIIFKKLNLK